MLFSEQEYPVIRLEAETGRASRRMEILRRNCLRMNKVSDLQDARYEVSRAIWNYRIDKPELMSR